MIIEMKENVFQSDPEIKSVYRVVIKAGLHPSLKNGDGGNVVIVVTGDTRTKFDDPCFLEPLMGLPGFKRVVKVPQSHRISVSQGNMKAIRSLLK